MARRRAARGLPPPPPRVPKGDGPRPFCYRCRRAQVVCVCGDVPSLETRTRVVIIQHEDEAWNRIGTARLAHLALPNSVLAIGLEFDKDEKLLAALAEPGRERVILFPSRDAELLEPRGPGEPPLDLVVIDGTWSQAKGVVKRTKALRDLPRVKLPPGDKSRYRIRLQPRAECVSTVEAAVRALGVLEGDAERFEPLIAAFDRMIDRQIEAALAAGRSPVRDLKKERAKRPLPPELTGDLDRVVIVFGETLGFERVEGSPRVVSLVQWLAVRPNTREVFHVLIDPGRPLEPHEARYLELAPEDVARGVDTAALRERWAAFVRPDDVFVSWGYFATNVLEEILGVPLAPQVDLRKATKVVVNRRVQHPENALVELELAPPAALAPGRGGKRLAALEAVVRALREQRASLETVQGPSQGS